MRNQVEELARKLEEKEAEMESMKSQVQYLLEKEKIQESKTFDMKRGQFNYMILKDKQNKLLYSTGLTTYEFGCLCECVEPFLYLIRYPDSKGGGFETKSRTLDAKTELMTFFRICRHSLHLEIMAWIVQTSVSTISRVFVASL